MNDVTPTAEDATISLQMSVKDLGEDDDQGQDIMDLDVLCPTEPRFSYSSSPFLTKTVWKRIFDCNDPQPLPLLFGVYFE